MIPKIDGIQQNLCGCPSTDPKWPSFVFRIVTGAMVWVSYALCHRAQQFLLSNTINTEKDEKHDKACLCFLNSQEILF